MTEKSQQNPLENLLLLNQIADAFRSMATNTNPNKGFDFGKVIAYEFAELEKLDDNEQPTGEFYKAAIVTLDTGKEIELNEQENKLFRRYWNEKCKLDLSRFNYAKQLLNQVFPN